MLILICTQNINLSLLLIRSSIKLELLRGIFVQGEPAQHKSVSSSAIIRDLATIQAKKALEWLLSSLLRAIYLLAVVPVCHDKITASLLSLLAVPLAPLISGYMSTVGWHYIHRLATRLAETDDLRLSHHILSGNRHSRLRVILGVDPHQLLLPTCRLRDLLLLLRIG